MGFEPHPYALMLPGLTDDWNSLRLSESSGRGEPGQQEQAADELQRNGQLLSVPGGTRKRGR